MSGGGGGGGMLSLAAAAGAGRYGSSSFGLDGFGSGPEGTSKYRWAAVCAGQAVWQLWLHHRCAVGQRSAFQGLWIAPTACLECPRCAVLPAMLPATLSALTSFACWLACRQEMRLSIGGLEVGECTACCCTGAESLQACQPRALLPAAALMCTQTAQPSPLTGAPAPWRRCFQLFTLQLLFAPIPCRCGPLCGAKPSTTAVSLGACQTPRALLLHCDSTLLRHCLPTCIDLACKVGKRCRS